MMSSRTFWTLALSLPSLPPPPLSASSDGFGAIGDDVREDNEDPLTSLLASADPSGILDQIGEVLGGGTEPLQNYLNLGDNHHIGIDNNIIKDFNTDNKRDTIQAIQDDFVYPIEPLAPGSYLVTTTTIPCPLSGIPQLSLELVAEQPSSSSSPPLTTTSVTFTPSPDPSTEKRRGGGKKRKSDSPDFSPSPSPAKISKATEWRKEQDKEIEKNDQLLKNYKAEVKEKEMLILIRQAILMGHHRQKTFDYRSKMASFDVQKLDIDAGIQKLDSIGKSQKKAEYKKAQNKLLASYKIYINTLTEEIQSINMKINNFP